MRELFGGYHAAIEASGVPSRNPWRDDEAILRALRADAKRKRRRPLTSDWGHSCKAHPTSTTVLTRWSSWRAACLAAGLEHDGREHPWTADEIREAIRQWERERGRWPRKADWALSAPGRPAAKCAANVAGGGSFTRAVELAKAG